eukprot:TRINITY_DN19540_c0_g2_i1.p1 TRINITY_DN19540_c0_g2~~TRINITY_DN19540_c0_g2_i1.p1  ORF type:complete len:351 (-),score=86.07 TRINITY_DN19540_c0_g2_i1:64-1116(-)
MAGSGSDSSSVILAAVAVAAVVLEGLRRAGTDSSAAGRAGIGGIRGAPVACKTILYHCAPEAFGLVCCIAFATVRLAQPMALPSEAADKQVWESIMAEWPTLTCADTLLALQAMLRLAALLLAALRGEYSHSLVGREVAALHGFACLARVALFLRSSAYQLDGPLGGWLPNVCDALSLCTAVVLVLGRGGFRRLAVPLVLTFAILAKLCSRHRFKLARGDSVADMLFMASFAFDFLGAAMYLVQGLLFEATSSAASNLGTAASRLFRHLLMAAQPGLAAYYFMYAFPRTAGIIGAGRPLEALLFGTLAAQALYLSAAVLHVAEFTVANNGGGAAAARVAAAPVRPREVLL